MSKLITASEASRMIGGTRPIPLSTLAYWRKIGKGPTFIKVGRQYRYPEDAVMRYLEQNTSK